MRYILLLDSSFIIFGYNDDADTMKTYIIKTVSEEYYCGKTNNIKRRMLEHWKGKSTSWFNNESRRNFKLIHTFKGDYEKQIKRAGIKLIVDLLAVSAS